ncbi:MAG: CoA transferase [Chloroflexi bacterium]|nr:CoA transferase [Chloroflexota bacterium]
MVEPLTGLRIVEMATALQGPAAGGFLCDMGAEVVKIEPPQGDASRYHRGSNNFTPEGTLGAQFVHSNRGKRAIAIDANSEDGREVIYKLVERADAFITNYRESALTRMGFGYEALRERNPNLVYAAVNGFGHLGPDADKGMVDGAGMARGGLMHMTGPRDGPPVLPGATLADMAGAMQLALATMTALLARERHGIAQKVNVSSYGAQIWLQAWEIQQAAISGNELMRDGSHHANIPGMYGVYQTSDDKAIFLAFARTEESWQSFCDFAGFPEIGSDERWNTLNKRMGMDQDAEGKIAGEIRPYMERAFASKTLAEWVAFLDSEPDIIYNRVSSHQDVLDDPQALANGYIEEIDLDPIGMTKLIGPLVRLSETPASIKGPPPQLGQHTEEVLLELGYDWEAIERINAHTREALRQKFIELGLEPPF